MKIYVNCSYMYSPVGFRIGTVDISQKTNDGFIMISTENISNQTIINCFEEGIIERAYGKIPDECVDSGKCIFLIKCIESNMNDEYNSTIHGSFAFEFDVSNEEDMNKYSSICRFINSPNAVDFFNKNISEFFEPDIKVKNFAYKFKYAEFSEFVNKLTGHINKSCKKMNEFKNEFFVVLPCQDSRCANKLSNVLGFDMVSVDNIKYKYKKKYQLMNALDIVFGLLKRICRFCKRIIKGTLKRK